MELNVRWTRPQPLTDGSRRNLMYAVALDKLPDGCGVYIFGRRWGRKNFEALYVGKANNIRRRVKGQLNNLGLMQHVKNAKAGKRLLIAGTFATRSDKKKERCLPLIERALIRHFLSEGDDLVNKLGTRIRRHHVKSTGDHPRSFFPETIYLEIAKGERHRPARSAPRPPPRRI